MEFDPYSEDFFSGAFGTYQWLRDSAPVYRNERHDFWALSRHEDVSPAYKDWETFSSAQGIMLDQLNTPGFRGSETTPGFLGVYDPPGHSRLRRLASQAFTPRAVSAMDEAARRAVDKYLEPLLGLHEFDFVQDFAKPFPAEVLYDLMGIPEADRAYTLALFDDYMSAGAVGEENPAFNQARLESIFKLMEYLADLSQRKRAGDADDIITRIVNSSYVDDDNTTQRLSDAEISAYLLQLIAAGIETTTKLMSGCLVALQRHPAQWRKVVENSSKIAGALEEAGRYEAPVQFLGRKTTCEVTRHGVTIPEGANILLMIGSANRDERVYQDPDVFDADRVMGKPPVTYGFGPHTCLGVHLARLEAQIALTEVVARWPEMRVVEEKLVRVRAFHNFGWENVPVTV